MKYARAAALLLPLLELEQKWTWGHAVWGEPPWLGGEAGEMQCLQDQSASCVTGECVGGEGGEWGEGGGEHDAECMCIA